MASLERRYDGRYRIVFCYQGKRFKHSLGKVPEREALACVSRLEESLRFVERGLLDPPTDVGLGTFLVSGGKLNCKPAVQDSITLAEFFRRYQKERPEGGKEQITRSIEDIHIKHLRRLIGGRTKVRSVSIQTLQRYVEERSTEKGRHGRSVSHATVKKEIGTFASSWNRWGVLHGFVAGPAPTRGLVYRKVRAKPPFQTWEQIERQIRRGGLTKIEEMELWHSLFLSLSEIQELLEHVRVSAYARYIFVMFCIAAFTGARRSEMLRSDPHASDRKLRLFSVACCRAVWTLLYDEREMPTGHLDGGRMAILADALEDAGCDNGELLAHLRGPGPHPRGCHAIDALLRKQ